LNIGHEYLGLNVLIVKNKGAAQALGFVVVVLVSTLEICFIKRMIVIKSGILISKKRIYYGWHRGHEKVSSRG
jgi:hypothetical protein